MTRPASDMPHPASRFWNRIARRYAAQPVDDEGAYAQKLAMTADKLEPGMRVLEFGCGTGTTALIHAPRVEHIDAIDFSTEMIAIAQEKASAQAITNVTFSVAAFEDWKAAPGSYDAIMAHSILHLVDDLDTTLTRVRAMLKPGGLFISSTVCIREMGWWVPILLPIGGRLGLVPKVRALLPEGLRAQIEDAGFETVESWQPAAGKAVFIIARAV